jgi:hypothetical protein
MLHESAGTISGSPEIHRHVVFVVFIVPLPASPTHLLPLDRWAAPARSALAGVFTDIDDTLTTDGAITPDALQALDRPEAQPASPWCRSPAGRWAGASPSRTWPVDAIVAENGAVALVRDGPAACASSTSRMRPRAPPTSRACSRCWRASSARCRARAAPPTAPGRETDIAIDHSEFTTWTQAAIDARRRADARRRHDRHGELIHVNGWYGDNDKLSGARWIGASCSAATLDASSTAGPTWATPPTTS